MSAAAEPDPATAEKDGPAGSLARGLAILEIMLEARQHLTLAEISALSRLDHATAIRLLRRLEESQYVMRMPGGKRYAPSPKALFPLGLMHPINQLRRDAQAVLHSLSEKLGETVALVLFLHNERMIVDIAQSPGSLTPYYETWLRGALHSTAAGKAMLLTLSPERRREMLGPGPFKASSPRTITDIAILEEDLRLAAERGFVVTRDEFLTGVTAIAVNIMTWRREALGCLVMTGPSRNFDDDKIAMIGRQMQESAKLLPYQTTSLDAVSHATGRYAG